MTVSKFCHYCSCELINKYHLKMFVTCCLCYVHNMNLVPARHLKKKCTSVQYCAVLEQVVNMVWFKIYTVSYT